MCGKYRPTGDNLVVTKQQDHSRRLTLQQLRTSGGDRSHNAPIVTSRHSAAVADASAVVDRVEDVGADI